VIGVVVLLLVGAIAAGVTVYTKDSKGAKQVAATYLSALGSLTQSLALSRVHGTWQVCPQGDRLRTDMGRTAAV
jgi:hypothetical protein